jgi:hypothetical protein
MCSLYAVYFQKNVHMNRRAGALNFVGDDIPGKRHLAKPEFEWLKTKTELKGHKTLLPGGESNPAFARTITNDRRVY